MSRILISAILGRKVTLIPPTSRLDNFRRYKVNGGIFVGPSTLNRANYLNTGRHDNAASSISQLYKWQIRFNDNRAQTS